MVDPHRTALQRRAGEAGLDGIHFHTGGNAGEQQRGGNIVDVLPCRKADQVVLPFYKHLLGTDHLRAEGQRLLRLRCEIGQARLQPGIRTDRTGYIFGKVGQHDKHDTFRPCFYIGDSQHI